jgi:hypothetical protein
MECIICDCNLNVGETLTVTRGLQTLKNASLKRQDGIIVKLENVTSVTVHKECRKLYTRPTSIKAEENKAAGVSGEDDDDKISFRSMRSTKESFDFRLHCLICGMEAEQSDSKVGLYRRKFTSEVRTLEMRNTIIHIADQRRDEWGDAVRCRVGNTFDSVAAEGRYHRECFVRFSKSGCTSQIGRPEDPVTAAAFSEVCDYIDNSDECQHAVADLLDVMLKASDRDHVYTNFYLKKSYVHITQISHYYRVTRLSQHCWLKRKRLQNTN